MLIRATVLVFGFWYCFSLCLFFGAYHDCVRFAEFVLVHRLWRFQFCDTLEVGPRTTSTLEAVSSNNYSSVALTLNIFHTLITLAPMLIFHGSTILLL